MKPLEAHRGADPGGISLDQMIALNDEIAALARAGLPLARGLMGVGRDLPGRLGRVVTDLGRSLEQGRTLSEALAERSPGWPSTYRAVVQAGVRSGRLPVALEGLSSFARSYADLRRAIGLALLYPACVLMVGYGLFLLLIVALLPVLSETFASMRVPMDPSMLALERLGRTVWLWGWILPALILALGAAWYGSGRASAVGPGRPVGILRRIPGLGGVFDSATAALFADWLALLVESGVPWHEALELAADATGDPRVSRAARDLAGRTRLGDLRGPTRPDGFPALLSWILRGEGRGSPAPALRHAADTYRRRAERKAAALRVALPPILTLAIGATATGLYAATLFAPWAKLMTGLARVR